MATPKLRFKEFDGDWNLSSLANISSIITGNTPSTSNREYYDGEFLFVSPVDIQENRYIEKTKTTLTANGFSKCRHIPENSVLFVCIGSTIGKVAQNKVICATNQQINAVIPKKGYSSDFLYLQLERLAPNIKLNAGVQAVPLINKTEFGKTLLNTPTFIEQTKIASFLSAMDEKVSQLTQKHELLSQYKQGMMQKLFSQQLRFKADDGSEFGEWEDKTIEQIANFRRGSFPQPYGLPEWLDSNGFPFVQVYDVSDKMLLKERTKIKISQLAADQSVFAKQGTLIITIQGSIGRIAKMQYDAYVDRTLLIFQSYNCEVDVDYFKYALFLLFNIEKERAEGAIIKTITKETLSKFIVQLPCLEEQTKIANFLSTIDQKIEVVAQQIEQAKMWKKGLLQQMFV